MAYMIRSENEDINTGLKVLKTRGIEDQLKQSISLLHEKRLVLPVYCMK